MGRITRWRERKRNQEVVTQHSSQPLENVVGVAWAGGAKRIILTKLRGESPERWHAEMVYDVQEDT